MNRTIQGDPSGVSRLRWKQGPEQEAGCHVSQSDNSRWSPGSDLAETSQGCHLEVVAVTVRAKSGSKADIIGKHCPSVPWG